MGGRTYRSGGSRGAFYFAVYLHHKISAGMVPMAKRRDLNRIADQLADVFC